MKKRSTPPKKGMNSMSRRIPACAALLLCIPMLSACAEPAAPASSVAETAAAAPAAEPAETEQTAAEEPDAPETYDVTDAFQYEAGTPEIKGDLETVKEVTFFRDGMKIAGKLYLPEGEGSFPAVIITSGQTAPLSYYADEAEQFAESGIACLIYDSIGAVARSNSSGKQTDSTVFTEAADLNVILDSVSALPKVNTEQVFLFGHSLGGLVCTYVGCHRPKDVSGMILLEPSFAYPDFARSEDPDLSKVPDIITDTRKYNTVVGKQFVIDMHALDIYEYLPAFSKDAIIFLGTEQGALGSRYPEYYERAIEAFPSAEAVTFEGADHLFQGEYGVKMAEKAIEFMQAHT